MKKRKLRKQKERTLSIGESKKETAKRNRKKGKNRRQDRELRVLQRKATPYLYFCLKVRGLEEVKLRACVL